MAEVMGVVGAATLLFALILICSVICLMMLTFSAFVSTHKSWVYRRVLHWRCEFDARKLSKKEAEPVRVPVK